MGKRSRLFRGAKQRINSVRTDDLFKEITAEELRTLQTTLLDMYKDIAAVCEKYAITPFLIGGSALGAVRHRGFIPWDDDLDVGMLREDYEKFSEVFEHELSDRYILNAPNRSDHPKARFPKVIKKGTVLREILDVHDPERNGIFLDIFILENVPSGSFHRKLKGLFCNALEYISGQVFMKENLTGQAEEMYRRAGRLSFTAGRIVGTIGSVLSSEKWFNLVDKAVRFKRKTGIYGIPTGRKHYLGEIFPEYVLLPAQKMTFEDIEAPVFHDCDRYLHNLYNDYMQIPKEGDREKHYIVELRFN